MATHDVYHWQIAYTECIRCGGDAGFGTQLCEVCEASKAPWHNLVPADELLDRLEEAMRDLHVMIEDSADLYGLDDVTIVQMQAKAKRYQNTIERYKASR